MSALQDLTARRLVHFCEKYRERLAASLAEEGAKRELEALNRTIAEAKRQLDPGPDPVGLRDRGGNVR